MTAPLDQAAALLDGTIQVRVHSVRAAGWVTRSALEEILGELVRAKGLEPGRASTRTLLGCIEVLYQDDAPQLASEAQYAWDALTQASHHHAYELSPTYSEIAALTQLVRKLEAHTPDPDLSSGVGTTTQCCSPATSDSRSTSPSSTPPALQS